MDNVPSLFDALGGPKKVSDVLGTKSTTSNEMKRRRVIPVRYWPKLIEHCKAKRIRGITAAKLLEMHTGYHS